MDAGFITDVGNMRAVNEDALLVLPGNGLFVVADGVGGNNSGEIASRRAVNGMKDFLDENPVSPATELEGKYRDNWYRGYFIRCYRKINHDIRNIAEQQPENSGMATTCVSAYFDGDSCYVTNIGDSRAYIVRDGEISQLTEDHSYVANLVSAGTLTESEAREHPKKNMITKALGAYEDADPDFYCVDIAKGDRLILCSDGLHGELTDNEIQDIVMRGRDMNRICKELANSANERGGHDNITVICISV